MELRCIRKCYDSTAMKLFEKDQTYTLDDQELEAKDLLRHFEPVGGATAAQKKRFADAELAHKEKIAKVRAK